MTNKQKTYTCRKHGIDGLSEWCPACMSEFQGRMPAQEMSVAQRIAALKTIPEQVTIPFPSIHQWIEELMGRSVWTHELAHPEQLLEELESNHPADIGEVLGKLPSDKPVLLVNLEVKDNE